MRYTWLLTEWYGFWWVRLVHFSWRCNLIFMPWRWMLSGTSFFFKQGASFYPRAIALLIWLWKGFNYGKSWTKNCSIRCRRCVFNMLIVARAKSHGKLLITCVSWRGKHVCNGTDCSVFVQKKKVRISQERIMEKPKLYSSRIQVLYFP